MSTALARLNELEHKLSNYLVLISDQSYRRAIEACVDTVMTTGEALASTKYDDCAAEFTVYRSEARSAAHAGQWDGGVAPPSNNDWTNQINWLQGYAASRGKFNFDFKRWFAKSCSMGPLCKHVSYHGSAEPNNFQR